jgi:nucleotide-binding universal stress UspA family protein
VLTRMLVGIDGSNGAANALRWAAGFSKVTGAELVVATATGADATDEVRAAAVNALADWCREVADAAPGITQRVLDGDPRAAIPAAAAEEDAGLVVVGTSGVGWFPAVHLGHVAHYLALHAARPVAVVPPSTHEPVSSRCVLVGVDGSAGSEHALEWAGEVARATGGNVLALHTRVPAVSRLPAGSARVTDPDDAAPRWVGPLADAGIAVTVEVVDGHPASALAARAASDGACLVVVGARGAGGLHDLHIGSVALRLLHHAQLPVVIVPDGRT